MLWKYFLVYLFSMVKFIFSPLTALAIEGNTWYYTYIAVTLGGLTGATFFYYFSVQLIKRSLNRRIKKSIERKKFTRLNKIIVKTKSKVGVVGLSLLAASFISIPIGSIVTAKFYRHKKSTIVILYLAIMLSGAICTGITYYFYN